MDFQKALKTVTYPEFFWADQYVHQTHEGSTMVGAKWEILKICAAGYSKNPLPGPVCS